MYTLTIANQKGGSGKSASCLALGQAFAKAGKRVLFVDCDAQASLTKCLTGTTPTRTLADLLTKNDPVTNSITTTINGDILAAGASMITLNTEISPDLRKLRKRLEAVKDAYDIVMCDTQPNVGSLSQFALFAADGVIIPAMPDRYGLEGIKAFYKTLGKTITDRSRAGITSPLGILGIVVTQFQSRTSLHRQVLEAMKAQAAEYGTKVFEPPIRATVRVHEWQYTGNAYETSSTAGDDYMAVAAQILNEIQ